MAVNEPFCDAAIGYLDLGWSVLPIYAVRDGRCACGRADCDSPAKHPHGRLAPHGLKDATRDGNVICRWYANGEVINLGIRTGPESGLVVLDIDPRHGGDESVKALGKLPDTATVATGGGRQLYFRWPAGADIRNSAGKLGPGLDIRGTGGYVVAPPSLHISGGVYRWLRDPRGGVAELPAAILSRLVDAPVAKPAAAAVEGMITEGKRNSTLTSLAGTMRHRGMGEPAILAALREENKRCDPPLKDEGLQTIARSIGAKNPGAARKAEATEPNEAAIQHEWVNGVDVVKQPVTWLWPARIPLGEFTLIGGNSSVGKSSIALFTAAAVTTGGGWPDTPDPCPQGSVLYLSDENSLPKVLVPRFTAMGGCLNQIRFHVRSFYVDERGERRDTPFIFNHYRHELERQMEDMKDVRLIVIDPLVSYVDPRRKLNDTQDMTGEMGCMRQFAEQHNIALLVVAMLNKRFDAPDISRIAGSYAIVYRSRAAHIVRYDPGDEERKRRQLICQKVFDGEPPQGLSFTIQHGGRVVFAQGTLTGYEGDTESEGKNRTPKLEQAIDFLRTQLANGPLERSILFSRAEAKKITQSTLKRAAGNCGIVTQSIGFGEAKTAMWGLPGTDFEPLLEKYGRECESA